MSNEETHVRDADSNLEVEIEDSSWNLTRTFFVPSEAVDHVQKMGRILNEENVEEKYYDRYDFVLSLNGLLLFTRNDSWNLRFEEANLDSTAGAKKLTSRCLTSHGDILRCMESRNFVIGLQVDHFGPNELNAVGFTVFHRVSYTKKVFGVPGEAGLCPAKISLDIDKFGFNFAKIDVLVEDRQSIPIAFQTINELAKQLGFERLSDSRSLRKYCGA